MYPKNRDSSSRRLTHAEFLNRLYKVKTKDEFTVIGTYVLQQVPIEFVHNTCGTHFMATPNNMCKENYGGCPKCSIIKRRNSKRAASPINIDIVENTIQELYPNKEYTLVKEKTVYINNKEKTIFLKCSTCDFKFPISLVNLRKKRGCPICNKILRQESRNVKKIKEFLKLKNVNFETEYKIPECRNERVLPFDFKFNINNNLKLLEYDGEFHDYGYNGSKKGLEKVQKNDKIKTEFCINNNIPLLRLRYNDFNNFEDRLEKFLSE